jgi:hypothetical protein
MNCIRPHRILPVLALGALLMAPSAWAAPRGKMAGPAGAEETWTVSWDFLSQLWSRAVRWAGKNGPSIDPNGAFPIGTKNGLGIDPNGGASGAQSNPPAASNPQDGSCLSGSGGCGP